MHSLQEMTDADEGRKTPLDAQGGLLSVISPVSFLSLALVKTDALGTSSTVWLTKAVDISVS